MMGYYKYSSMALGSGWGLLCIVTWILFVIFLMLGIMYYYKALTKKK